ncbi:helix-turn-helix domain-containing protein [Hyphomonas adhaerens]|uniref:helix-turn-helix domain-containing protein n=1 Tax=Hyphomonas adhaerens TaxID=81029 RepID=UPI0023574824|nr:helix-turn-helix transcriptional regulator [Hyphomonas adhaerens]
MSNLANSNGHETRKPTDADRFVGQKVRQARRELGLTQEALSSLLGVTFQQIQKYEAGQSRLSAGRLREIAIVLNKPIDYFYEPFVIELPVSQKAERDLKIMGLRQDGKRLIDRIEDDRSLRTAIHILEALEKAH